MNALDRVISWFSPALALRREHQRALAAHYRRYEGGGGGRRFDGWPILRGASANTELQRPLPVMRDRHRSLMQNNPWVQRAKNAVVTHTISYGITTQIRGAAALQAAWRAWTNSTACDATGVSNWAGLQALIWGTVVESGECLVRLRWARASDKLPVPIQLQVLEPDYLDHGKTVSLADGGQIIMGVELDKRGRRVAYWLFESHPGDLVGSSMASVRVPAAEVLHIFRRDRPDQQRGVPWGHSIILTARDSDELEDAVLMQEKYAAAPSAFLHDLAGVEGDRKFDNEKAMSSRIEPGGIEMLPPGMDVKLSTPPAPRDLSPMLRSYLMRIAVAYGISYASLTGDLTRVNYSSGRMGHIDMGRNIEAWQWQTIVPQLLDPVVKWFEQGMRLAGVNSPIKGVEHGMPTRAMVDPGKEYAALALAVRNGFKTFPAALRELGEDPEEVLREHEQFFKELDKLELVFDTDPRRPKSGAAAAPRKRSNPAAAASGRRAPRKKPPAAAAA